MAKKGKAGRKQLPADAVVYRGPVRSVAPKNPDDMVTIGLSFANPVNGAASGGINYALYQKDCTSCTDWASCAAMYGEYRVLGLECEYLPHFGWGNATVAHSAGFSIVSHSSDVFAVSPSLDQLVQHADWKAFNTGTPFKIDWRMSSVEEGDFNSTAAPSTVILGGIQLYAPAAVTVMQYGYAVNTFLIQFRDRK